jgi:hypothetical protein
MTLNKKIGFVVVSSLAIVSAAQAEDGFKAGGFVDPQLQYTQGVGASAVMNDGAIYMSKSLGDGTATIDLAFGDFQFSKFVGLAIPGGNVSISEGLFGTTATAKSQAFVAYKYSNGFNWKFGQFDGIFGFERNDTVDSLFSAQGGVFTLQPKVHQALLVGYELSKSLGVQAYVGGSDGSGLARTTGSGNPQIGAKVSFIDAFRLGVGGYMETGRDAAEAEAGTMFLNATAGMNFGDISLDAEYSMDNSGVDGVDATTGVGVYAGYTMGDNKIMARWTSVGDVMGITVGPNFGMTKDLAVKINVNYDINSATEVNTAALAVATTYRF